MRPSLNLTMRLAGAAAVALSLGACARQDRMTTGSIIPNDVRARHPIVLADAPQTLDLFIAGDLALDRRQAKDVEDFARDYQARGNGVIQILVPRGAHSGRAAASVPTIRRALAASGVRGHVDVGSYDVADPNLAAPVRLTYAALSARVATRCGEWPDDLGAAGSKGGFDNRPYYNLGCATQQNFAAQVADARDLVRPRHLDPADSQMRIRAITYVRKGEDPGTKWGGSLTPKATPIGEVTP
jgi:pilus assembly protein CpaD